MLSELGPSEVNFHFNHDIYLYAHYNSADLTMLTDWSKLSKRNIDILKKSYSSLITPIKYLNSVVYIRDTLLLSSAAAGTLAKVGLMHKLPKLTLDKFYIENMDVLFDKKPELFMKYAMQDSLITLIHALFMNDFSFRIGNIKNPVTLGAIANKYLKNNWDKENYSGYQAHSEYPLGNVQISSTPRGITSLGVVGESLNGFIGSFRGGRNECFTYGVDTTRRWYDYDLTSCYATIMSMCKNPNYLVSIGPSSYINDVLEANKRIFVPEGGLTLEEVFEADILEKQDISKVVDSNMIPASLVHNPDYSSIIKLNQGYNKDKVNFKEGYSALNVKFKLPKTIKYPPIPINLDENITIYPLEGIGLITGLEFLSACNILKSELTKLCGGYNPDK
ncbi:hypothetical protein HOY80DRAFT_1069248 [Tuber brumale]|nr:hypothetical protein HOY80DRAFT_1069248 [Tuber brumale]